MNNYRSVFSIPEPPRPENNPPPEPPTKNFTNDYYKLLTIIDKFTTGQITFSELQQERKKFD